MIYRHPFPGPGLGVRILGEGKKNMPIFCVKPMPSLCKSWKNLVGMDKTAQAFAVFQPVKSVGVVGDGRHMRG